MTAKNYEAIMQKLSDDLIRARSCYKHFAGELGVTITRALLQNGGVTLSSRQAGDFEMTDAGRKWCARYGIGDFLRGRKNGRQKGHRACMDYSHREPHLAGEFGRALFAMMFARGYCRGTAHKRGVQVTPAGAVFLREALGIEWQAGNG